MHDNGIERFWRGYGVQMRVIGALTIRELHTRFGRHNVGYLWMIFEPMMLAIVMGGIHEVANMGIHLKGIHPYAFTLLGYNIFIIFRNVFNRADHMLDNASYLLLHRLIKPLDIVLSKGIVEIVGVICSLVLLTAAGTALGLSNIPVRPLYLLLAIFLMSWLSIALSILIAAYTYESHLLSRFVHPFSYFMVPLSGAFFTMNALPIWARGFMAWNPLLAIFEIARYGQFEVASDQYLYIGYAAGVCTVATYWGLIALRKVESKIHVS